MLLVFDRLFSAPVITRIDSIGAGWVGGGSGGWWGRAGSCRQVKAPIRTQRAVLCIQYVTLTDTIHKGGQDCRVEQLGTPCSPINAPQG